MAVRMVRPEDACALLNIYAQYIETPITFETILPTAEQFEQRIRTISKEYPYLVWEENGKPIGYAYAHRQKERQAYQWNAELSIYIDRSYVSNGIGKQLYRILIELLKLQGIKTVYGVVTVPNQSSESLHKSLGFRLAGVYRSTGYKCGKWRDVVCFEKQIGSYEVPPSSIISFDKILLSKRDAVLFLMCNEKMQ